MAETLLKSQQAFGGDGWQPAKETWTYASADDPTFTFTIAGVDLTSKYSAGMRIKLTQTTVKYFIITKVEFSTNTTITVYGGTDYDLADAAISLNYYSSHKAPQGFPLDPTKWTVETTDVTLRSQNNAASTTWYNLGSVSINIPIGCWRTEYFCNTTGYCNSATSNYIKTTLSTANNSESDADFTSYANRESTNQVYWGFFLTKAKILLLSSKTTYYINSLIGTGGTLFAVYNLNDSTKLIIRAICAYL